MEKDYSLTIAIGAKSKKFDSTTTEREAITIAKMLVPIIKIVAVIKRFKRKLHSDRAIMTIKHVETDKVVWSKVVSY
jgi:hypothetical protein